MSVTTTTREANYRRQNGTTRTYVGDSLYFLGVSPAQYAKEAGLTPRQRRRVEKKELHRVSVTYV